MTSDISLAEQSELKGKANKAVINKMEKEIFEKLFVFIVRLLIKKDFNFFDANTCPQ